MAITLTLIAIVLFSCILADKFSGKFGMPANSLAIMIKRNGDTIIPNGDTKILGGDNVILSVPSYEPSGKENLEEVVIDKNHSWCDKRIQNLDLPENVLITLIKRGDESLIPDGGTYIRRNDVVVTYR